MYVLHRIQIFNLLFLLITIAIGLIKYKQLKENKILILLPALSICQILISEFASSYYYQLNKVNSISKASVDIYSGFEFVIIILFYNRITSNQKIITVNKIILLFSFLFYGIMIFNHFDNRNILMDYFVLLGGVWVETILLYFIINSIKTSQLNALFSNPNYIACSGFFLSYIIILPVNVLQNLYVKYVRSFFSFLFLSNSLAYFILFIFIIISFYVSGKSRNS